MKRNEILDLLVGWWINPGHCKEDPKINDTWYRLLETIRQYALEKLLETGEASQIRDQHLDFVNFG